MSKNGNQSNLFAVHVNDRGARQRIVDAFDSYSLGENLYLVRSKSTQSQLYHEIKRLVQPERLFVGKLEGDPKFKGVKAGALKWVRGHSS